MYSERSYARLIARRLPIFIGSPVSLHSLGKHADIYRFAFLDTWVWAVFLFMVLAMTSIYRKIAKTSRSTPPTAQSFHVVGTNQHHASIASLRSTPELAPSTTTVDGKEETSVSRLSLFLRKWKMRLHQSHREQQPRSNLHRQKQTFATQALLYCMAYAITWDFSTYTLIRRRVQWQMVIPIVFLLNILQPLQGFWNAFIYIRPRYMRYRKKQQDQLVRLREQQQREQHQDEAQKEEEHRRRQEENSQARNGWDAQRRGVAFIQAVSVEGDEDEDGEQEELDYVLDTSSGGPEAESVQS